MRAWRHAWRVDDGALSLKRYAILLAAAALTACTPTPEQRAAAPACDTIELTGDLQAAECEVQASGQVLRVSYGEPAAGTTFGSVSIDVLGDDGQVVQTLVESEVSHYRPVTVMDIDGDGRADIQVPRDTGNVNTTSGLWIFKGEDGRYARVGEVTGVAISRTGDGYIVVPARSSAVAWSVAYFGLGADGLVQLATVEVVGDDRGGEIRTTCRLTDAPGLSVLALSDREAEAKFCAEPAAAEVFAP